MHGEPLVEPTGHVTPVERVRQAEVRQLVLEQLDQIGRLPRLGRLKCKEGEVHCRVRDARRVRGRRRAHRRQLGHLLRCASYPHKRLVEDRLAEVRRKARSKVLGLARERFYPVADARRKLEDEPAVVDPLKIGGKRGQSGRSGLGHDADVARRGPSGRLLWRGRLRVRYPRPPGQHDEHQAKRDEAGKRASHQRGTCI